MIVYHAGCLHMRITDGSTEEFKAAFFEVGADPVGKFRPCGNLRMLLPLVYDRFPAGKIVPEIIRETAVFFLSIQKDLRVTYSRLYFEPVTDNAGVLHETFHVLFGKPGHFFRVETGKSLPVTFAFTQDREPAQAGLGAFKHQEFEDLPVVTDRLAPFLIMVLNVFRRAEAPGAADGSSFCGHIKDFEFRSDILTLSGQLSYSAIANPARCFSIFASAVFRNRARPGN